MTDYPQCVVNETLPGLDEAFPWADDPTLPGIDEVMPWGDEAAAPPAPLDTHKGASQADAPQRGTHRRGFYHRPSKSDYPNVNFEALEAMLMAWATWQRKADAIAQDIEERILLNPDQFKEQYKKGKVIGEKGVAKLSQGRGEYDNEGIARQIAGERGVQGEVWRALLERHTKVTVDWKAALREAGILSEDSTKGWRRLARDGFYTPGNGYATLKITDALAGPPIMRTWQDKSLEELVDLWAEAQAEADEKAALPKMIIEHNQIAGGVITVPGVDAKYYRGRGRYDYEAAAQKYIPDEQQRQQLAQRHTKHTVNWGVLLKDEFGIGTKEKKQFKDKFYTPGVPSVKLSLAGQKK